ncbi:MAG TPA: transglycosylase SLT domain-containing protein [Polyangiaceae bacterium]|nr:transglycosylase SLT domain-containing protein [Polyangiaceae bacterium]
MRRAAIALLCGLSAGCTAKAGGQPSSEALAPASSTPTVASSQAPTLTDREPVSSALEPRAAFLRAMRELDWSSAAARFDELSSDEQRDPELCFARTYCARELGDHATVLRVSEGLEHKLPLLAPELARLRAEAALGIGQHAPAIAFFSKQQDPADLLKAARAQVAASKLDAARQLTDRALNLAAKQKQSHDLIAEIRAERAQNAARKRQTQLMALDLRWLAVSAPTTAPAIGADRKLEALPGQFLTRQERYERALAFAEAGRIDDTEAELVLLAKAPGPNIPAGDLLHVQAWARYASRSYAEAALLFDRAIAAGTQHRLKDSFYVARALSRADKDLEAIERYQVFLKSYPTSGLAEEARYLIARLYYVMGRWPEAATAYNKYLGAFAKRGRFAKTARYELAVTRLAQRDYPAALVGFRQLIKDEETSRLKTRYQLLEAVALIGNKNREAAVPLLRQVIADSPLSFAALAAQERLRQLGETPPPFLPPGADVPAPDPLAVNLPEKVALLARAGLDQLAETELEAHEARLMATHKPREYESLCQAYGTLSGAERRYQVGQRAASWALLVKPPNPRTSWLWDCVYPRPYPETIRTAAAEFDLPPHLIYAVMRQESGFRPTVVSPANAIGLMQLIEPTARRVAAALNEDYDGRKLRVPRYNVRYGAYYLRRLLDTFDDNVVLAAAAYNAGPLAVSHWLAGGETLELDVFVARIPYSETRGYVERVVENLARYAYLEGGAERVPQLALKLPSGLRAGPDAY